MKRALITGVTGQDGAYLSKLLLHEGYEVYGTSRRLAPGSTDRLRALAIHDAISLRTLDLADLAAVEALIADLRPDEVYNLAAQSSVTASFEQPLATADVDGLGVLRLLEVLRRIKPDVRFFQASSGEMFGRTTQQPQTESTPFEPCTPYAVAKLFGHWMTITYRQSYGMFACSGLLFNHESPLRGLNFVTRKIARAAARIRQGLDDRLELGNLDARRDWGFAGDYARAMWLMLQHDTADDYVVATGATHTVREFVELAFQHVGLSWHDHVRLDPALLRGADVASLLGDASKVRRVLGWNPTVSFAELVRMMVDAEMASCL